MNTMNLRLEFVFSKWEPRDLWVGVFWDHLPDDDGIAIYLCPLPTWVTRFDVYWKKGTS